MSWSNYDDVLRQMRSAGLLLDSIDPARRSAKGAIKGRCLVDGADKEKRGWYLLHELATTHHGVLLVGSFGVFQGNSANAIKVELPKLGKDKPAALSAEQLAALKARIAKDRREAEALRAREAERAAARAQAMWVKCNPTGTSAYLERKGVGAHGVRFTEAGAVVVPMLDVQGRVRGLQFILPPGHKRRESLGRDKTYWPAGLEKQGTHFTLGNPGAAGVQLIAEGYATAASLFEAAGLPTICAFDAGNLLPVAEALHERYPRAQLLICADDDYLSAGNPGVTAAEAAALAVGGATLVPAFAGDRQGKKITDFNDLHQLEGLHVVRQQVEARIRQLGWAVGAPVRGAMAGGRGDDGNADAPITKIDDPQELFDRYSLVYDMPETVFDGREHMLVPQSSLRNLCTTRYVYNEWATSPQAAVVRRREVGFDPAEEDPAIKCNLWGGWPTQAQPGSCATLLELLWHLCSNEANADEVYAWVLKWLAYPIQHPGAKMRSTLVFHGGQGTGKNMFFEAVMAIYGRYGRIIDQNAVEDKYNDWLSGKLFLIADEVVARVELFHVKNKLKGIITGEWVRVNPKHVAAYEERNHVNLVFLSNEVMPTVLERDDRRHLVVWTPPKLDLAFYETVRKEIADGGVAALHHHLLTLDLGDFKPWTMPPMTVSKADLIDISLDSTERFWNQWLEHELPLPICPVRSEDLFDAYRHWCHRQGVHRPAQASTFLGNCAKRPGATKTKRRYHPDGTGVARQCAFIMPPERDRIDDIHALSDAVRNFRDAVKTWRDDRSHLEAVQ